jgi:hypothetical protein
LSICAARRRAFCRWWLADIERVSATFRGELAGGYKHVCVPVGLFGHELRGDGHATAAPAFEQVRPGGRAAGVVLGDAAVVGLRRSRFVEAVLTATTPSRDFLQALSTSNHDRHRTRGSIRQSGDVNIAYQVTGGGAIDLVLVSGFVSHLEIDWEDPRSAYFLDRIGSFSRLIRFDNSKSVTREPATVAPRSLLLTSPAFSGESSRASLKGGEIRASVHRYENRI